VTPDSKQTAALDFTLQVERYYRALMRHAASSSGAAPGLPPDLGGKLLYAGELDAEGRALLVAANIAGAASLTASADAATQKQAIRDGVADFLVNSLDEALRILKNEVRKREAVAVCIAAAPEAIELEMLERGVVADLLRLIEAPAVAEGDVLLTWSVDSAPAQWLPKVDAIALECSKNNVGADGDVARRWLRMAPRYLGRLAEGVRVLRCNAKAADEIAAKVRAAVHSAEIGVDVRIGIEARP
jgi:urocanate hydratase